MASHEIVGTTEKLHIHGDEFSKQGEEDVRGWWPPAACRQTVAIRFDAHAAEANE